MTERMIAAQEFVFVFEAVAAAIGRSAALSDARVQAARRRYLIEREAA